MKPLLALLAALCSGCFSSWAITQSSGNQRLLDERVREERIPQPGVREFLRVTMPLSPAQKPFAFQCTSTQSAHDTVYRSGFRYGSTWKKVTAAMFLVEAGIATAYYFGADREKPGTKLAVGFFGLDALGTLGLFFAPRKEIYTQRPEPIATTIRNDCPAGLLLDIAGTTYPVDAAGRIGELGEAALHEWMKSPSSLRLTYEARVIDLAIHETEICTWNRNWHQDTSACPGMWAGRPAIASSIEVPMGTLTRAE